jgi:hypothetical protein
MKRVIISAGDLAFEAIRDSFNRGECPILAESPFITKEIVKEWMYATEGFIIYNDSAPEALVDHALHLGVPITRRSL